MTLFSSPASAAVSLLLMHGLSMNMWRSFLNTTIPTIELSTTSGGNNLWPRLTLALTNGNRQPDVTPLTPVFQPVFQLQTLPPTIQPIPTQQIILTLPYAQSMSTQSQPPVLTVQSKKIKLEPKSEIVMIVKNSPSMSDKKDALKSDKKPIYFGFPNMAMRVSTTERDPWVTATEPTPLALTTQPSSVTTAELPFEVSTIGKFDTLNTVKIDKTTMLQFKKVSKLMKERKTGDRNVFKRICYYLLNVNGEDYLRPDEIEPTLCTHIIVGFVRKGNSHLISFDNPEDDAQKLRSIVNLKRTNADLLISLALDLRQKLTKLEYSSNEIENEKIITKFTQSIIEIVDIYSLDGIDLFWNDKNEPNSTGEMPSKEIMATLIKSLRKESIEKNTEILISASVSCSLNTIQKYYDIQSLSKDVDFVNLLCFDAQIFSKERPYTAHHSALYSRSSDKGYFATLNAAWAVRYWTERGMPSKKMNLGVATFGRTYRLTFPNGQGIEAPAIGFGLGDGRLNYTAICSIIADRGSVEFDETCRVPFLHNNFDWISYENEKSVSLKARFIASTKLAGAAVYALNFDDWKGLCRSDSANFPLQRSIVKTLKFASLKSPA